jgi:hypothetical protein
VVVVVVVVVDIEVDVKVNPNDFALIGVDGSFRFTSTTGVSP